MRTAPLENGVLEAVTNAAEVLRNGGVILYPTDTLYGLGADAFSDTAVDKVYSIKGRDQQKPIHCVVADMAMADEYAIVDDAAKRLAERFLPGPLTLVLKKRNGVVGGIARDMETIGIRIPKSEFCIELARAFGKPYTATSANLANKATENSTDRILQQLGRQGIDLVIDAGPLQGTVPSTVVDLSSGSPIILREGAILAENILSLF